MLCLLTARTVPAEAIDDFRAAWEPNEWPSAFVRVYHLQSVDDERQIVSFALFDGTREDLERLRDEDWWKEGEHERREAMAQWVEATQLDGAFTVLERVRAAEGGGQDDDSEAS